MSRLDRLPTESEPESPAPLEPEVQARVPVHAGIPARSNEVVPRAGAQGRAQHWGACPLSDSERADTSVCPA